MTNKEAILKFTLRLADNALVIGHRLGEWCGKGPILEEDLALTNLALDMIGRAEALLRYAAEVEGKGHSEDYFAYKRGERNFYNHLLCEQSNGDFAHTIVRQLFISVYEGLLYEGLIKSKDLTISAIATKSVKEIKYHRKHATDWCIRLGDGTDESHERMNKAIHDLWMFTGELFETDEVDEWLLESGVGVNNSALEGAWKTTIIDILSEAKLSLPQNTFMQTGGRNGVHTEHLGHILTEMQYLQRAYPDAVW